MHHAFGLGNSTAAAARQINVISSDAHGFPRRHARSYHSGETVLGTQRRTEPLPLPGSSLGAVPDGGGAREKRVMDTGSNVAVDG